jgi:hypothetical protein
MVEPWLVWSRRVQVKPSRSLPVAKEKLEQAAQAIGAPRSALPWLSGAKPGLKK